MSLEITVRGSAEKRYPAEMASIALTAVREGMDRELVYREAVAIHEPLVGQLKDLHDLGAVGVWSSEQVRVYSHRPWSDGRQLDPIQTARLSVWADFTDFERLSGFVDYWAAREGVEVGGIHWDVTPKNRRIYEGEVRRIAVDDAVTKAQAYADAVRRGRVTAVHLADPGMLKHESEGRMMAMAAGMPGSADARGGPALELAPDDIYISVEVDARFVAD